MDTNINEDIAKLYLSDSLEFLNRYNILNTHQSHMGNRAKIMIDLLFALECSLKALAFLQSKSSEKEIYKKIKTHRFEKLIAQVNLDDIPEIKLFIQNNLSYLSVDARYLMGANQIFRNEIGSLDKCYHETIANPSWMKNFYDITEKLYAHVGSKIEWFSIHNFSGIDIKLEIEKINRIKNIGK